MIKLILKGSVPSKKNNKRIVAWGNRVGLRSSDRFLAWHHDQMMTSGIKRIKKIKGPVSYINLYFYRENIRRVDLSNMAESVMDLLVDAGIIEDDNIFIVPELSLHFGGIDKKNPRVEVYISTHPDIPEINTLSTDRKKKAGIV